MSRDDHQLFIGRLPRGTRSSELEDVFYKYGKMSRCDVKQGIKMAYGFIEYEDKRDAEDALRGEHGRDFNGARIVVEWARGPKDTSAPRDFRGRDRDRGDRYDGNRFRDDDRRDSHRGGGGGGGGGGDDRSGRYEGDRSRSPRHSHHRSSSRSPHRDHHHRRSHSPDHGRRSHS